jgi:hypothetical protein
MERKAPSSSVILSLAVLLSLMLIPATAAAQITGIAGVVKDATGAVLPGVTVEAASPELIEKVRTVVTDDRGQYMIVDLRPGLYSVTFTLPGFSTLKRDAIELAGSFTATVNAELKVGAMEETVTVSGQSPLVDTRNVINQRVMSRELVDDLPTSRNFEGLAQIIPGLSQISTSKSNGNDVGGSTGERGKVVAHGARANDNLQTIEGLSFQQLDQGGSSSHYAINPGEVQEFTFELSGFSAENPYGNVYINMIPKEGGNRYLGSFLGTYASNKMQSSNLTPDLITKGLTAVNGQDLLTEINPSYGGPLKQDKLWFFTSYRRNQQKERAAGMFFNATPLAFKYTADKSRPGQDDNWMHEAGLRLTWQASAKNKLSFYYAYNPFCQCHRNISATVAPEASVKRINRLNNTSTASWKGTLTSRILLEAGMLIHRSGFWNQAQDDIPPGTISVTESSTTLVFRAPPNVSENQQYQRHFRFAASYITGAHAFKVGADLMTGLKWGQTLVTNGMTYQLLSGTPNQITVFNTPRKTEEHLNGAAGFYVQDQWTFKRLSLNGGVRIDNLNASIPAVHLDAGPFVPARDFPAVSNVPNWHDVNPRAGVSYDLFGNGKTAVKVTLNRYITADKVDFAALNEPSNTAVASATRQWTDSNVDFVPQESELGGLSNTKFGTNVVTTHYDDSVREGWGVRPYNWETTIGVQHQLLAGTSVSATYFRRSFGNFLVVDNQAVTRADYDAYCVTAPSDARLPNGGGNQICGLYEVKADKFGVVDNLVLSAKKAGVKPTEQYQGLDLTLNARLPHGVQVSGGLNSGTASNLGNAHVNSTNTCFVIDSPQAPLSTAASPLAGGLGFCDIHMPWRTQVKFLGTVALPWNLSASGTLNSSPGPQMTATYQVPNASIFQVLGRNPGSRVTIDLVKPGTMYGERLFQVDLRIAKALVAGRTRIKGTLDLFNALNGNAIILQNNTYTPAAWQQPTYVLPGRIVKVGTQIEF